MGVVLRHIIRRESNSVVEGRCGRVDKLYAKARCVVLQRSSTSPLDIKLGRTAISLYEGEMEELARTLVSEAYRWRNITFIGVKSSSPIGPIRITSPHLASLAFHGHPYVAQPIRLDFVESSPLRVLNVTNSAYIHIPKNIHLRLPSLTRLHMSVALMQRLDDLLALIEASPSLFHLNLMFENDVKASTLPRSTHITLKHLAELHLDVCDPCEITCRNILSHFTCPILSLFSVFNGRGESAEESLEELREIEGFLRRSGAPLSSLDISSEYSNSGVEMAERIQAVLTRIITPLDHLELLTICDNAVGEQFVAGLCFTAERGLCGAVCPMLKGLSLMSDGVGLKKQTVIDMVGSRCKGGRALEDVFLDIPDFDSKFAEKISSFVTVSAVCDSDI